MVLAMTHVLKIVKGIAHKLGPALFRAAANALEFVVRQRVAHIERVRWSNIRLDKSAVRLLALAAQIEKANHGVEPNSLAR
jgi:hypothetical protein